MIRPFIGITTWRRFIDTDLGSGRPAHSLGTEYAAPIEPRAAPWCCCRRPPVSTRCSIASTGWCSPAEKTCTLAHRAPPQAGRTSAPRRGGYELALARGARERGLPVLAICRGLQVSNIAFGGSLIVDIPTTADHRPVRGADQQLAARHPITLAEGSRLAALYGTRNRVVNTIHHQSIDVTAPGLHPVAWAPDGIVEAVEADDDWPFWAVQWHPEKMIAPDEAAEEMPLFAAFVSAARERAAEHPAAEKGTR